MVSRKRTSPHGAHREERWLGSDRAERARPWAYEDLLFGSDARAEADALGSLAADLVSDLAELKRMQAELYDQVVRLAVLAGRLQAARASSEPTSTQDASRDRVEIRSLPSDRLRPQGSAERGGALARCEGFRVDSPTGFVGFVDGLRFVSRIDEPDLLEVRGGRFGRELALIPIEAVEEVSHAEERIVIRSAPALHDKHLHELVERVRKVLHSPR